MAATLSDQLLEIRPGYALLLGLGADGLSQAAGDDLGLQPAAPGLHDGGLVREGWLDRRARITSSSYVLVSSSLSSQIQPSALAFTLSSWARIKCEQAAP